ncbi:MAG: beta-galactosidase trimerization domain-containing protein, partial [Acidobacteria bacterium]|nr:beta-galactosidase trimerization domain-containing protein [Acidobacteriota bacterium]
KYVAVVASEPTMFYRGRADSGSHANDLVGALRALDALHIQHDVVADWNLDAGTLRAYQLVILPNAACLSDRQVAALREYVRQGGRLWATAETSLLDENGGQRPDFALADVLGIHLDEQPGNELREKGLKKPAFLLPDRDHAILRGLPRTELILPTDSVYVTAAGGETPSRLILDAGAAVPSPGRRTERAAIHSNRFGSGQAVYVANSLFASTRHREQRGVIWADRLIRNVVEYLARSPPWRLRGPQAIWAGMNYQASGKRHVIHLVNWQPEMPIDVEFEVTKTVGAGGNVAMVWPRRQVLQPRTTPAGRAFTVPRVGPHVIITME